MVWTRNSSESSYESPNLLANIDSIKNAGMLEQGWNRVLVSLFSWPGQLLVLVSLPEAKILARMLFLRILSLTVVITDIAAYLIKDCD